MPNGARAWDKIIKQRIKTLMFVRVHHSPHDLPSYSTVCFLSRPVNAYVTRHVTGVIQSVCNTECVTIGSVTACVTPLTDRHALPWAAFLPLLTTSLVFKQTRCSAKQT